MCTTSTATATHTTTTCDHSPVNAKYQHPPLWVPPTHLGKDGVVVRRRKEDRVDGAGAAQEGLVGRLVENHFVKVGRDKVFGFKVEAGHTEHLMT